MLVRRLCGEHFPIQAFRRRQFAALMEGEGRLQLLGNHRLRREPPAGPLRAEPCGGRLAAIATAAGRGNGGDHAAFAINSRSTNGRMPPLR